MGDAEATSHLEKMDRRRRETIEKLAEGIEGGPHGSPDQDHRDLADRNRKLNFLWGITKHDEDNDEGEGGK